MVKRVSKSISALTLCLCLMLSFGCAPAPAPTHSPAAPSPGPDEAYSTVGFYFDTVITLKTFGGSEELLDQALAECAELEALLSKTVEGSDVWNINHAQGKPVTVDDRTRMILECAENVATRSGGAFDITIAPAAALWVFTGDEAETTNPTLPDADALAAAAALVDYTKLSLEGNTVTLPAGMEIDLGGIAKGFIGDQLAVFFRANGVENAMINLGGNVVAIGAKPGGQPWNVGVRDPGKGPNDSIAVLRLKDGTVVTSGIYERGFDLDGMRYHHLLDTKTGWPIQNELASATIICEQSMLADALSTACFALGPEKGLALLKEYPGVEAVFIKRDRSIISTAGAETILANVEG